MRSLFLPKSKPKITEISELEVYWRVIQKSEFYAILLLYSDDFKAWAPYYEE
jgi:hypothetical protein